MAEETVGSPAWYVTNLECQALAGQELALFLRERSQDIAFTIRNELLVYPKLPDLEGSYLGLSRLIDAALGGSFMETVIDVMGAAGVSGRIPEPGINVPPGP